MFEILKQDRNSRARLGLLKTEHGVVETPAYVIVGTHGAVRCLEPEDLPATKTQLIIANTYHLWRLLGEEALNEFTGLHDFMQWQGPLMTDSGGFQVFSLGFLREAGMRRGNQKPIRQLAPDVTSGLKDKNQDEQAGSDRLIRANERMEENNSENSQFSDNGANLVRITEAGVYFLPDGEGEKAQYLDAELSIKIQAQLGADIIVAFDEPTSPAADYVYTASALGRTHAWALRSLAAKTSAQLIWGVVQGGAFADLRKQSAETIGKMPFDGFAIGSTYGDAYGGTKAQTLAMLRASMPYLLAGKPRHLFGVGRIEDILAGVEEGIDTFDCVIPTREARHGGIWTEAGRLDILKGKFLQDSGPLAPDCGCFACAEQGITRQDLHSMFKLKNPEAGRLATIHNVYFFNDFMEKLRLAIKLGQFKEFKQEAEKKLVKSV